ncbi:hypothetical protein PSN45_001040 [Yamadazyma tenuis]|uniref:Calcium channel YVC1-like C-terminal transmembrane domain-containing protein n=1 Tax=Candida tenuis (strain ATCC 10573 / BCRC 21748 / CBS 615 / JCM 9827 / NBRC 10315 / NRRL Y-1498 / VKM Y-70) TaxID=590646 RepID=G3B7T0_CANTC|nr:uncharacterized protein CANTEDRAFT_95197 [Yamadazyma tenuis ATCC 10573]EGV62314.1 hypothetical protein CANTEDRAFT_95197 [Yamadazyma tenuis ATCC 10573]WEJ93572.1 hypothetical protein PSN45_001040 [Yamadazyma tenuis]
MQKVRTRNTSTTQTAVRYKELEFKYLYFKIQKLVNRKVQISLKYEQLKQPEINLTLIKPIVTKIVALASNTSLGPKIRGNYGSTMSEFRAALENKVSVMVIHILMVLRYEFLIQSDANLIVYDLLMTKATVCELLAIRIYREYKAFDRVQLLFVDPLKKFTTLELVVLTKSKKFLSQPIIVKILEKFYNGELIMQELSDTKNEESTFLREQITNYNYSRASLTKINDRSRIVPKYQSLVINLKNLILTMLHVMIIVNQHKNLVPSDVLEFVFYCIGLHLNYEFFLKLLSIQHKFLRKILWFYMDFAIIMLIDINIILKVLSVFGYVSNSSYFQTFSILSILLIPRNLSMFNNYRFFSLIILGFRRMISNIAGLFCLFFSLIIAFYITFISINFNRSNSMIAFDLLQIFFGFTPAVWTNWDTYSPLGKVIQIGYLFLSQFIISTILAIVLSESFSEISHNIKEDFEYFKAVNLVIYFKSARLYSSRIGFIVKLPILVTILVYELLVTQISSSVPEEQKHFTFLAKDRDYYSDNDLVNMDNIHDESDVSILIRSRQTSVARAPGQPLVPNGVGAGRRYSQLDGGNMAFVVPPVSSGTVQPSGGSFSAGAPQTPVLMPIKSISTLGNFKSASTDSLFIGDLLAKRYGVASGATKPVSRVADGEWDTVLDRLGRLDDKLDQIQHQQQQATVKPPRKQLRLVSVATTDLEDINRSILDDVDNESVQLYDIREGSYDLSDHSLGSINSDDNVDAYRDDDTLSEVSEVSDEVSDDTF